MLLPCLGLHLHPTWSCPFGEKEGCISENGNSAISQQTEKQARPISSVTPGEPLGLVPGAWT